MVGRSNVGKSSLINSLFGQKTARTSKTPGRTQAINIFSFSLEGSEKVYYLFDLPGYGHAQVSKKMGKDWSILMDTFFRVCGQGTLLINLQDCRHPLQKVDAEFGEYIAPMKHSIYLIFNKIDKLKQKERNQFKKFKKENSKR